MTDKLIFEDPANRLPEWAEWAAEQQDGTASIYDEKPVMETSWRADTQSKSRWNKSSGILLPLPPGYYIPGVWFDSLRRIVRLTDPAYYCAENPHTDDEGFLPHDGGPRPEWLITLVHVIQVSPVGPKLLPKAFKWGIVRRFRIVSKEPAETDTSGGSVDGGDRSNVCTCQGCGEKYKADFLVPDDIWELIRPRGSTKKGGGLLCGCCIVRHLEGCDGFGAWTITSVHPTGRINRRSRLADLADELHLLAGQVAKEGKDA